MTKIAFIGLGNMGGGMAANQAKAGHGVAAFDLSAQALERAGAAGCVAVGSVAEAVKVGAPVGTAVAVAVAVGSGVTVASRTVIVPVIPAKPSEVNG